MPVLILDLAVLHKADKLWSAELLVDVTILLDVRVDAHVAAEGDSRRKAGGQGQEANTQGWMQAASGRKSPPTHLGHTKEPPWSP